MEQYALENHVPIMELVSIESLLQVLRLYQPKRILEIGTAIGYSSLRMAKELGAEVVTIERNEERYKQAQRFLAQSDQQENITLIFGDALEVVEKANAKAPYDVIFIDAAKGQYKRFFDAYTPMLSERGIVVSDNVLFKGYVTGEIQAETRRKRSLIKKINDYNEWLMGHSDFQTAILPIGDGIAISTQKR
ncbi:O-methyltransferase [Priestia filamentosa]|nr:SAM-dependent methyltransferase [Priestia filamentosa]RJS67575.1 O-methyltransferase [Priestia filamentosa]